MGQGPRGKRASGQCSCLHPVLRRGLSTPSDGSLHPTLARQRLHRPARQVSAAFLRSQAGTESRQRVSPSCASCAPPTPQSLELLAPGVFGCRCGLGPIWEQSWGCLCPGPANRVPGWGGGPRHEAGAAQLASSVHRAAQLGARRGGGFETDCMGLAVNPSPQPHTPPWSPHIEGTCPELCGRCVCWGPLGPPWSQPPA